MRAVALAVAMLLLAPGAALGARAFTLGSGYAPNVDVAPGGKAHFTWYEDRGMIDRLHYCQVPRGRTACENARTFKGTGDAAAGNHRTYVFTADGGAEVVVLASWTRPQAAPAITDHMVYRSTDGGKSFGQPYPIGDPQRVGPEDVVSTGESLGLVTDDVDFTGAQVLGSPMAGFSAPIAGKLNDGYLAADPSIALKNSQSPVVTADYRRATRVFYSEDHALFRTNLIGLWKQAPLLPDQSQAVLTGGPNGVYAMLIAAKNGRCPCRYVFRRWGGTRFASAFTSFQDFIGTGAGTGASHDFFQDGAGRLHAVWAKATSGGGVYDPTDIRYARSTGGAADFGARESLLKGFRTGPSELELNTAGDGQGFVIFARGRRGGGTSPDTPIQAAPVGGSQK